MTRHMMMALFFLTVMTAQACLNDSWLHQREQDMILAYNSAIDSLDSAAVDGHRSPVGFLMFVGGILLIAGSIALAVLGRRKLGWLAYGVGFVGLVGAILVIVLFQYVAMRSRSILPVLVEAPLLEMPLPHSYPKTPGGLALQLSMVHDVLHERYARHSSEWYEARNVASRAIIEAEGVDNLSEARLAAMDDLSVGLDLMGKAKQAVEVQRRKLALIGEHPEIDPYTTYANLGTHLIHLHIPRLLKGEAKAAKGVEEGLAFIEKAIEVNPDAHFGRERWQAEAVRYLLAAHRDPSLLTRRDMAGLEWEVDSHVNGGHAYNGNPQQGYDRMRGLQSLDNPSSKYQQLRTEAIERVEVSPVGSRDTQSVPFDEPLLAMIGMWQYGGGPNPHFSLTIAHLMQRIGQRYLAWYAFERTRLMADRFSADPEIRYELQAHCVEEQDRISSVLDISADELRANFTAELEKGQAWQKAYQAYEAEQIAQGIDLSSPDFYTAFYQEHGQIETATEGPDRIIMPDQSFYQSTIYKAGVWLPSLSLALGVISLIMLALSKRKA